MIFHFSYLPLCSDSVPMYVSKLSSQLCFAFGGITFLELINFRYEDDATAYNFSWLEVTGKYK